ncbi:MAG: UDP-N-acetylmuramoyl-tripeptide--D-alanyl-D-alanine ligase [Patescibacteria group bacterium]
MVNRGWKQPFHNLRRLLAKTWLKLYPQVTIIGITGSYGKTNTTRAIAQVLSGRYPVLQTDLNLDTVYNLPITILKLRPWHKALVLEMGVDHKGEMDSYLRLVKPSIGVVTGITPVHSEPELLGSLEGIIEGKGKLLAALPKDGWAILNYDDENVRKMAKKTKAEILWYGKSKNCDFWADKIKVDFSGTSFLLHKAGQQTVRVKIPLIGKHFTHAALAATAIGLIKGLSLKEIISGLSKLEPLSGRLSLEKGPLGTIFLNDHLRANPVSTISGLETLSLLPTKGKRVAVLGEMGELGEYAEEEHRKIGRILAKFKIDFLVLVGPLQRLVAQEAEKSGMKKKNVVWVKDVCEAGDLLKKILKKGDLIYLKGSLLRHLERIILILEGKPVNCKLSSCHFYQSCLSCPKLGKEI